MSGNQHKNIGDEIKDIVQDAIGNNNFQHLNEDISNTINSALYEVKNTVDDIKREFTNSSYRGKDKVNHMKNRVNSINKDVILDATRQDKERNVYRQNNQNHHRDNMNQSSQRSSQSTTYSTSNNQSHNGQNNRGNTYKYSSTSRSSSTSNDNSTSRNNNTTRNHNSTRNNVREMNANKAYQKNSVTKIRLNPNVGQIASVLYTVFGSIFGLGFGVCTIVFFAITRTGFGAGVHSILSGIFGVGFLIFLLMFHRGSVLRNRIKRFKRYITIINGRNFCTMTELGDRTGLGKRYVLKDVKYMIKNGMFIEGNIDGKGTCLMLNQEAYDMYVQATNNLALREKVQGKKVETPIEKETDKNYSQEVLATLNEGKDYIKNIKLANDFIDDIDVSLKLDRMEQVTKKIFEHIEKHPDKLKEIRRFMDYYLPTTMKLLNAYKKFDEELIQGDNIKNSKLEISRTLDTINNAFENLLDDMYEEEAMDISTDISVLETILMQEGLTEQKILNK